MRDGLDHAAAIWNPEGDVGDMEIWEIAEPLLYLGRNVKTNPGSAFYILLPVTASKR